MDQSSDKIYNLTQAYVEIITGFTYKSCLEDSQTLLKLRGYIYI